MIYKELRERVKALCFGEGIFKDNVSELKTLTDSSLIDIANRVIPFSLVTSDLRKHTPLRYINDHQFIRYPAKIIDDFSVIELDDALHTALSYGISSLIVSEGKRAFYHKSYCVELDRYTFACFKQIQNKNNL